MAIDRNLSMDLLFDDIKYGDILIKDIFDNFQFRMTAQEKAQRSRVYTLKETDRWDLISLGAYGGKGYELYIWIWNDIIDPETYLQENTGNDIYIPDIDIIDGVVDEMVRKKS